MPSCPIPGDASGGPDRRADRPTAAARRASTVAVRTEQQFATFLAGVTQDRLYAAWWLAALRGLRRDELTGLRWTDIDLQTAELAVT
ncbi:hypothetical protein [Nonomuraea sp. NPDC049504]|jgi:integrase|uniref:hypothetical protein n=1 Tax=Nonomuraea sp. NPDC049504 TaxID=3154729 RepID=UPI0034184AD1